MSYFAGDLEDGEGIAGDSACNGEDELQIVEIETVTEEDYLCERGNASSGICYRRRRPIKSDGDGIESEGFDSKKKKRSNSDPVFRSEHFNYVPIPDQKNSPDQAISPFVNVSDIEQEQMNIGDPNNGSDVAADLEKICEEVDVLTEDGKEEYEGTGLLLMFNAEFVVPSKEEILAAFREFGTILDSETKLLERSHTWRLSFENFFDARNAFRSLERMNPFNQALVNYRFRHSKPYPREELKSDWNVASRMGDRGVSGEKTPLPIGNVPPVYLIKQSLEKMTNILKKSGNDLEPEMRMRLEDEIRILLGKVNEAATASSS